MFCSPGGRNRNSQEPLWIFPLWPGSSDNGGLCAGTAFKKYISLSQQLSWNSWAWADKELQSPAPLGGHWARLLALWQREAAGSELGTQQWWLREALQHPQVPAALQGWFQLWFTPLPYSWESAHMWYVQKYAGAHVGPDSHVPKLAMYQLGVVCKTIQYSLLSQVKYLGRKWEIWGYSPLDISSEQEMHATDAPWGWKLLWLLLVWHWAGGGVGWLWLWLHPPRWWPGSARLTGTEGTARGLAGWGSPRLGEN